jgi:hypothetical protein
MAITYYLDKLDCVVCASCVGSAYNMTPCTDDKPIKCDVCGEAINAADSVNELEQAAWNAYQAGIDFRQTEV